MIGKLFLPVLFSFSFAIAQFTNQTELDINTLRKMHLTHREDSDSEQLQPEKCSFGAVARLRLHLSDLHKENLFEVSNLLSRPGADTSIVSSSGKFRVHYFLTGDDKPSYSVTELCNALDSSYNFMTEYLQYPAPPGDGSDGGDNKYDVYVLNLGYSYGYTTPETELVPGSGRFTSFITIDNDFSGYYTTGIFAAQVTAAHELFHAIQIGNYIIRKSGVDILDLFFYELSSTAMEEFVFDSVNDYVGYMKSYMEHSDIPMINQNGYNLAIWNLYLERSFGHSILRRQWELLLQNRALSAIYFSLMEAGTGFIEELKRFMTWCYFTGYRAIPGEYFEEAESYPHLRDFVLRKLSGGTANVTVNNSPTSGILVRFYNPLTTPADTVCIFVVNGNINDGENTPDIKYNSEVKIQTSNFSGAVKLTDYYYCNFLSTDISHSTLGAIVNGLPIPEGGITIVDNPVPYPNPFIYGSSFGNMIVLPLKSSTNETECDLKIFNSSFQAVFEGKKRIQFNGGQVVQFRLNSDINEKLSSGVYFYIISYGNDNTTGKFLIIDK